jgi:aminoglycoside 3-N-acetyltransferase
MRSYSVCDLEAALRTLGLSEGDTVLVHSSLFPLGQLAQAKSPAEIPRLIYETFRKVIGNSGTILVPAAFERYARFGEPYDCRTTPVDQALGVFSQFVHSLPESIRTYSPLSALSAVGPLAGEICHQWTGSSFGEGSCWERLYHYDGKICFLGVRPRDAFNFQTFIQARFGVPHLYNKLYMTPIYEDGAEVPLKVVCPVRYLNPEFAISENCLPFQEHLEAIGELKAAPLGRGQVFLAGSSKRVFAEGQKKLRENLYFFCKTPPQFIPGIIPMDGPTGEFQPDSIRFKA